jgi:hypothetical protein
MTTRNYNPDDFDWGDETENVVRLDQEPDLAQLYDTVSRVIQRTTMKSKPLSYVRPSKLDMDKPRPTYNVKYGLTEKQKEWLENEFIGWQFTYNGNKHHDHPLSHIARELNEYEMVEDISNKRYIDLFGNVGRNRNWKRSCVTLVSRSVAKDYLRHRHGGGLQLDWNMLMLGQYKDIGVTCLTHSLYYLSLRQIAMLAGRGELRAIVHRHSATHGYLNNGEQEYWVDRRGNVTQVNVDTGEKYTHPSLEPFFHQDTAKTPVGGVTWTIKKLGGDTYEFTFVRCPIEMAAEWKPLSKLVTQHGNITVVNDVTVHKFFGWSWYTKTNHGSCVDLVDVELVDKLRKYIAGKPRTARNWENLSNHARRNTQKYDVISLHGGGAHMIPAGQLVDYVNAAFYMDAKHELESAISFASENATVVKALNAYYEHGTMPTNLSVVSQTVEALRDMSVAAGGVVRDLVIRHSLKAGYSAPQADWADGDDLFPPPYQPAGVPLDRALVERESRDEMWAAVWRKAVGTG